MKKLYILLLLSISIFMLNTKQTNGEDLEVNVGSFNVVGLEDYDYQLMIEPVRRSQTFEMDNHKATFYMLGCDLVYESDSKDKYKFVIRDEELGAKFVFISPEAGRKTGTFATPDFYPMLNSILRVKNVDRIVFEKVEDIWLVSFGEVDIDASLQIEEKDGTVTKLKSTQAVGYEPSPYVLDLGNYTLKRTDSAFEMNHNFSSGSILDDILENPKITFKSSEILFRTFESRLSIDSNSLSIKTDRKPTNAIVGQIIRFTGDSDDGDNLASILAVDIDTHTIYISRHTDIGSNEHDAGTWIRCFNDSGNGQVYDNEYPKISLEPAGWFISEAEFQGLLNAVSKADPTGLLNEVTVALEDDDAFGYSLSNVTYSKDGLNFTGGMTGAFHLDFELYFFGRTIDIGPARIDYADGANGIMDEILRINTYKKEAFRFYFNPKFLSSYANWDLVDFNPPDTFPLTFRLYFDKEFELIGGNIKIKLPGKGIPLPGGLLYVDNVMGGFTHPSTFEVGAAVTSFNVGAGFPLWNANADFKLSLDEKYLEVTGDSWLFGRKIQLGDFDATVAWSYYTGKHFKGVEISAELGVGTKHTNAVIDMTFKMKRYKSSGTTKTYIGGTGRARIDVFGKTFGGVKVSMNTYRFKGSVKLPILGRKSFTVYYASVLKNISSLSAHEAQYGIATYDDDFGNTFVLLPEAKRIVQPYKIQFLSTADTISNELELAVHKEELAITLDYSGLLDTISVTLPSGITKEVEIAMDDTVVSSDRLYAADYDIGDNLRQLYIQVNNADAGMYTVNYGDTLVDEIAMFEIVQVPEISDETVTTSIEDAVVSLNFDLDEVIDNTAYHVTLVRYNASGDFNERYEVFEDIILNEESVYTEVYLDERAITTIGNSVSFKVALPSYLQGGEYAFLIEPVLDKSENLYGLQVVSEPFVFEQSIDVTKPSNISSTSIGNSTTEVRWDYQDEVDSYIIEIIDGNTVIDTYTVLKENLVEGMTRQGTQVVIQLGGTSTTDCDVRMEHIVFDESYNLRIVAVKEKSVVFVDVYNSIEDYIDMDQVEAQNHNETITLYKKSDLSSIMIETTQVIQTEVSVYQKGNENSAPKNNINHPLVVDVPYEYDEETDKETENMSPSNTKQQVFTTNSMDVLSFMPAETIHMFYVSVVSPAGDKILEIPKIGLNLMTTPNQLFNFMMQVNNLENISPTQISQLIELYNAKAVSFENGAIKVDMDALQSSGIIDQIPEGRYDVNMKLYTAKNDVTDLRFELLFSDFVPSVFIDSAQLIGDEVIFKGIVNGAKTLLINDTTATLNDGQFSLQTSMETDILHYRITDMFGIEYEGTLIFTDDIEAPKIQLESSTDITLETGAPLTLPKCTATDNVTNTVNCEIDMGGYDSDTPGTYTITFSATDDYQNEVVTSIMVSVTQKDDPAEVPGDTPEAPIDEQPLDTDPPQPNEKPERNPGVIVGIVLGVIGLVSGLFVVVKKLI